MHDTEKQPNREEGEQPQQLIPRLQRIISSHSRATYVVAFLGAFTIVLMAFMFKTPTHFPVRTVVSIEEGATLDEVAADFKKNGVINSRTFFTLYTRLTGNDDNIVAGDYYFTHRQSLFSVADRVTTGDYGLVPVSVTIPEGATVYQIADILSEHLDNRSFDKREFVRLAEPLEGYLFPDTYSFQPNTEERKIIDVMKENFATKVEEMHSEIEQFGRPLGEVIIMASLLEKEARTERSRKIIAGILWKRLDMDMPLQVDAVFPYINGKNTFELTHDDLDEESPYNTYRYKGLPIGPIANPGLDSIKAAVNPIETDYLFYLSDMEGNMHYAENFEQHKYNKRIYLN